MHWNVLNETHPGVPAHFRPYKSILVSSYMTLHLKVLGPISQNGGFFFIQMRNHQRNLGIKFKLNRSDRLEMRGDYCLYIV